MSEVSNTETQTLTQKMQWKLEGRTTKQEIQTFIKENPLPQRGNKFWTKVSDKFLEKETPIDEDDKKTKNDRIELLFATMCLKDEDGMIDLYKNIDDVERIKKVGEEFNKRNGMNSLYINICILREAIRTMTDNDALRISILKTIVNVWKDNGIWKS